jgi:hypothetical protein
MGGEVFDELLGNFEGVGAQTSDGRRLGYNQNYEIQDGIKSVRQHCWRLRYFSFSIRRY